MVALAVLAISLGVVAGSLASAAAHVRDPASWPVRLETGRAHAIAHGEPTVVWPDSAHLAAPVLFLPDGRVVGLAAHESTSTGESRP
jgi:hypothetical protein